MVKPTSLIRNTHRKALMSNMLSVDKHVSTVFWDRPAELSLKFDTVMDARKPEKVLHEQYVARFFRQYGYDIDLPPEPHRVGKLKKIIPWEYSVRLDSTERHRRPKRMAAKYVL